MSHHLVQIAHRRRAGLVALIAVLGAACMALATGSLAAAAPPAKVTISIASAYTQVDQVPDAPGKGTSYVVQDQAFTVTFTTTAPLSTVKDTPVVLTASSGKTDLGTLAAGFLAAGETTGTIKDAVLADPANGVLLTVDVQPSKNTVKPGTLAVDVLKTSLSAPSSSSLVGIGGGGGIGVPCSPTADDQVCGDLIVPATRTAVSNQLLSQGCVGTCAADDASSFLQALFALGVQFPDDPVAEQQYEEQNPIVFIAKCDKTLCAGKGIKSYSVKVTLQADGTPTRSPACSSKGVVDSGEPFCTDYVQSTRDNAGDVFLYVLLTKDAKIIFG
jgi:hypothetical protein